MRQDAKLLHLQQGSQNEGVFQFASPAGSVPEAHFLIDEVDPTGGGPVLNAQLLDIHEYERQRMGQELHDSAGQLLVSLQLSVARLKTVEHHEGLINEIQDTVRQIDREIRALAFLHYPAELGGRSLCEAVQAFVQGFGRRTGIRTTFKCLSDPAFVAEQVSLTVLRVAQEALVNVHRHSHASSAKVTIHTDAKELLLTVSDDGIGIGGHGQDGRGIGLKGMRHRVEMQGGRFNVRSLKHGTKISAAMPFLA